MKVRLTVTLELDEPAYREDVADHVAVAVARWGGQYRPDNPLSPRNIERVRVKGTGRDDIEIVVEN